MREVGGKEGLCCLLSVLCQRGFLAAAETFYAEIFLNQYWRDPLIYWQHPIGSVVPIELRY